MAVNEASPSPQFSIVVPAYQESKLIGECVEALCAQTIDRSRYEIIVVDDASTDDTAAIAEDAGADVVVHTPHGGAAAARNAGVGAAQGVLVLFTDADCAPSPEWLARMVAPFTDPTVVGTKGTYRTQQRELIARLVQLEFEIRYERMAELPEIDFIDTYSAAYRRDVMVEHGGFSTDYPVPSAEDVDFSFRLAREGHRMLFVPDAWVRHVHPNSLWSYLRRKMRFGYWRALLYVRYPDKIAGDAHTDPALKLQFALVALCLVTAVGCILWRPLWIGAALALGGFFLTTLPFVRWAWARDRPVALAWPFVTFLRVVTQGAGLAFGFLAHLLKPSS